MISKKKSVTIRIPTSISYKLGVIDAKLVQNDEVHQEILRRLDGLGNVLSDLRDNSARLTVETASRTREIDSLTQNVTELCSAIIPIQTEAASRGNQIKVNTDRLTVIEAELPSMRTDLDQIKVKAGFVGGVISLGVAGAAWLGKTLIQHITH